jgi:hypothetical protein
MWNWLDKCRDIGFWPWRWNQYAPSKRLAFSELHGVKHRRLYSSDVGILGISALFVCGPSLPSYTIFQTKTSVRNWWSFIEYLIRRLISSCCLAYCSGFRIFSLLWKAGGRTVAALCSPPSTLKVRLGAVFPKFGGADHDDIWYRWTGIATEIDTSPWHACNVHCVSGMPLLYPYPGDSYVEPGIPESMGNLYGPGTAGRIPQFAYISTYILTGLLKNV